MKKKEEMIPLAVKEIKSYQFVIYPEKDLVLIMKIKNIIKSEITVIMLENTEELLIIFVI